MSGLIKVGPRSREKFKGFFQARVECDGLVEAVFGAGKVVDHSAVTGEQRLFDGLRDLGQLSRVRQHSSLCRKRFVFAWY
jgi:hypothetical protein